MVKTYAALTAKAISAGEDSPRLLHERRDRLRSEVVDVVTALLLHGVSYRSGLRLVGNRDNNDKIALVEHLAIAFEDLRFVADVLDQPVHARLPRVFALVLGELFHSFRTTDNLDHIAESQHLL